MESSKRRDISNCRNSSNIRDREREFFKYWTYLITWSLNSLFMEWFISFSAFCCSFHWSNNRLILCLAGRVARVSDIERTLLAKQIIWQVSPHKVLHSESPVKTFVFMRPLLNIWFWGNSLIQVWFWSHHTHMQYAKENWTLFNFKSNKPRCEVLEKKNIEEKNWVYIVIWIIHIMALI